PEVIDFLEQLQIPYLTARPQLKKWIFHDNSWRRPKVSLLQLVMILLRSFKPIPTWKLECLSVKDFFAPILGDKLCEEVLAPALTGIYATH
ncbi:hypothetical protein NPN14_24030, partial [Vibrio parahaemolyticus]|uniref:hypothetical protein n=1 Tax=Vibrio parahaemolyticus TaxID=670 RepID=UPI002112804B